MSNINDDTTKTDLHEPLLLSSSISIQQQQYTASTTNNNKNKNNIIMTIPTTDSSSHEREDPDDDILILSSSLSHSIENNNDNITMNNRQQRNNNNNNNRNNVELTQQQHHDSNNDNNNTNSARGGTDAPTATTTSTRRSCCTMFYNIDSIQLIAMISNYSTSYNVINISLVLPILKEVIIMKNPNITSISSDDTSIVASSLLFGMIIGQMIGGALGDIPKIGRINALRFMMMIQIIASIASSILISISSTNNNVNNIFISLALWRLLLGVGAGGVYPLAAVLSVEQQQQNQQQSQQQQQQNQQGQSPQQNQQQVVATSTEIERINNDEQKQHHQQQQLINRNIDNNITTTGDGIFRMISSSSSINKNSSINNDNNNNIHNNNNIDHHDNNNNVVHRVVLTFSMQGAGFITVPILAVIMLYTLPNHLNIIWRLLLGLGSIPGIYILYLTSSHSFIQNNNINTTTIRRHRRRRYRPLEVVPTTSIEYNDNDLDISSRSDNIVSILNQFDLQEEQGEDEHKNNSNIDNSCYEDEQIDLYDQNDNVHQSLDENHHDDDDELHHNDNTFEMVDNSSGRSNNTSSIRQRRRSRNRSNIVVYTMKKCYMTLYKWYESIRNEENIISKLIGTAGTWFLFDILFYGNTLFQPIVIETAFGKRNNENPIQLLQQTALDTLLLTSIALPGYIVAGYAISGGNSSSSGSNNRNHVDNNNHETSYKRRLYQYCCFEQTPRYVMLQGFFMMSLLYFIIGILWNTLLRDGTLSSIILLLLYGFTFFFANYGPNTITFILPSLIYTKNCRSTLNGICAAFGKFGAFCGAMMFDRFVQKYGDPSVMIVCSLISIISYIVTYIFVPIVYQEQSSSTISESLPQQQQPESRRISSDHQYTDHHPSQQPLPENNIPRETDDDDDHDELL